MVITCPHCIGLGLDPNKAKRREGKKCVTWTFQLKDDCPRRCGTGRVVVDDPMAVESD